MILILRLMGTIIRVMVHGNPPKNEPLDVVIELNLFLPWPFAPYHGDNCG